MEDIMQSIQTEILTHVLIGYLASVIVITFVILNYIITKPNKFVKIITHFLTGVTIALIWLYVNHSSVTDLLLTFSLTYVVYSWFIKTLCDKFGVKYDNGIGITN